MADKKPMGRPPKPEDEVLSETVQVRLARGDYEKLGAEARRCGLTVSEYLREVIRAQTKLG